MNDITFQSTIRVSQVNTNTNYKVCVKYEKYLKLCEWANYAHLVTWLLLIRIFPKQSTSKFITTRLLKTKRQTEYSLLEHSWRNTISLNDQKLKERWHVLLMKGSAKNPCQLLLVLLHPKTMTGNIIQNEGKLEEI